MLLFICSLQTFAHPITVDVRLFNDGGLYAAFPTFYLSALLLQLFAYIGGNTRWVICYYVSAYTAYIGHTFYKQAGMRLLSLFPFGWKKPSPPPCGSSCLRMG